MNPSIWFSIGGLSGAAAIGFGAFGGHGLQNRVKEAKMLENWKTASYYHLINSVALLLVPFSKYHHIAGPLLASGTLLFSGSLYAMVLTDNRKLGMITPIGGLAMMGGWAALGLGARLPPSFV
ncbi:hypothetical protein DFA_01561 [Cavenderia fasciculata]|uniref:Transmembrane protein n=1 Tax=Cavenderia fasciculata TaxID=261658 RepID=F4PTF3_CACFS|nr:uncharacterized protein DFA_01561 [Cavenderia fasciculata]EGG21675.1 hypothetical protein DFA_01561 [Cavenderia fasciculata]|eukprot:XP_004359525.1 hypothetical protein DFA_01561 [Cavenderia fasciculata]